MSYKKVKIPFQLQGQPIKGGLFLHTKKAQKQASQYSRFNFSGNWPLFPYPYSKIRQNKNQVII